MGHKQPDARVARLMLEGSPWSFEDALSKESDNDLPHGGAHACVASAIGGLGGWADGDRFAGWLRHALAEIAREPKELGDQPRHWPGPMLILETALRLREAAQDARESSYPQRGASPGGKSINEYVFCLSHPEDCAQLDAARRRLGLEWSEEKLLGCARALIAAMDGELRRLGSRPDIVSACAPELAARLELARQARPDLLSFLLDWRPIARFPTAVSDLGCVAYESQRPDQESFEMSRFEWSWTGSASSAKNRQDFPWGLWLAWSVPSLVEEWGEPLGANWEADAALAREISRWQDDDQWGRQERALAAGAAVALERAALNRAASPAAGSAKKPSL